MISMSVEQKSGAVTRYARVSASTIERAVELAAPKSGVVRVVVSIDGGVVPATLGPAGIDYDAMSNEEVDEAFEAGLPGAYDAWVERVGEDLGQERFEVYATQHGLV